LKSLRRDKIGDFKLENSWDFEILKAQLDNWREIEKTDVS
jgi:hypothetical protein